MKILLVEDDPATRALLEKALMVHHSVEVATDGRAALTLAEQFDYDLMLLDINIPEVDGISVCKQLRTQGYQIPILLLTAQDGTSDRVLGLDAGADDYMVKPCHIPELLARIRALQRRGRTTASSVITWENLRLDCTTNEIHYGDQLLRLTPKEYSILELMLLNPQRIFSRSAMIDRLWELGEPPTESAISSHIKAIRQKLKAAGVSQDPIETIYGFGYRLRAVAPNDLPPDNGAPAAPSALEAVEPQAPQTQDAQPQPFSPDAAQAVMVELWERFKDSFTAQVDLLEQVVEAFQRDTMTPELRQGAKQTVHKLVGSLGVYGFPQGSVLARQIDDLLRPGLPLADAEIQQMADWVAALQREVSGKPGQIASPTAGHSSPATGQATYSLEQSQVLVVDDDAALTARLQAEARRRSLQITIAPHPTLAQPLIEHRRPDVILLDLTFSEGTEDGLSWLATLKQQHPQIPVLVFTGRDSLDDRVAAARLGAQAFLQKPIAPEQIFQAIAQVLRPDPAMASKVLIVDDDPLILHRVSAVLSPWGLQITPLLDPHRFWAVLTQTRPDLLILDIEMPGFNGIELCQVVRHDPQWGDLPILFLTAHQELDMIVQAFTAGGDDYIRKPILEPELIARVLNRLEPGQMRRQNLKQPTLRRA